VRAPKKPSKNAEDSPAEDHSDQEQSTPSSDDGFDEPKPTPAKKDQTPTTKPKKNKFKQKDETKNVKPPTLEEMKELRDTQNLFHSNLFKLQVKEMLQELQLKSKYTDFIDSWLESFTAFTRQLKDGLMERTHLEVPLNISQKPTGFVFSKPTREPYLIGAVSTGTLLGPKIVVDVALEMPKESLHKDDYLNLRYDQKRALYLTYVTERMKESPNYAEDQFSFNYYANNPLKPVLELTPVASWFHTVRATW